MQSTPRRTVLADGIAHSGAPLHVHDSNARLHHERSTRTSLKYPCPHMLCVSQQSARRSTDAHPGLLSTLVLLWQRLHESLQHALQLKRAVSTGILQSNTVSSYNHACGRLKIRTRRCT